MLTSSRQPQTPSFSYHEQPLDLYEPHSPTTSTLPFYFSGVFSQSTPSLGEFNPKLQRHQSFGCENSGLGAGPLDVFGGSQPMYAPSFNLQPPPIRVQQSSPTLSPQQFAANQPSPLQSNLSNSMLANQSSPPQRQWSSTDGSFGLADKGTQYRQGQSQGRRAQSHQRNTSGSSVASAGPASPFDGSAASHPHIAGSDGSMSPPNVASSPQYAGSADHATSPPLAKIPSAPSQPSFLAPAFQYYDPQQGMSDFSVEARLAMLQAMRDQQLSAGQDSPVPDFATPSVSGRDQGSPANSRKTADDYDDRVGAQDLREGPSSVPQLNRTMSDAFQDELFDPSVYNSSAPTPQSQSQARQNMTANSQLLSPYRTVFSDRIHAANNARSQSPIGTPARDESPFRQGSPYAPSIHSFGSRSPQPMLSTASRLREQQKAEADSRELQQHQQPAGGEGMGTANTISPKDALLDYSETEEDSNVPLFPSDESPQFNFTTNDRVRRASSRGEPDDGYPGQTLPSRRPTSSSYTMNNPSTNFPFVPPSIPGSVQMPSSQQYSYASQPQRLSVAHHPNLSEATPEFPAHLTSMETSASEAPESSAGESSTISKPAGTRADSGTYTCTYHGCTLRFETPAKLQKHKREGHRQATPAHTHMGAAAATDGSTAPSPSLSTGSAGSAGGDSSSGLGMTSAALMHNSQAGPHKCERINPSTGKPCNTIFSRPYDLTRHEDTIHNARKQKVHCQYCDEDKTFSRNDALTRHMRVVHPDIEFGAGRSRRKHHT